MTGPTVEDVQKRKRDLEAYILSCIRTFEEDTGCHVESVRLLSASSLTLDMEGNSPASRVSIVYVEVKI